MREALSKKRETAVNSICNDDLDLLVVGGGVVGSGVARDAAMRGLKVGLIDRHDFAFGSSNRTSRLLHGGIRYLQQMRVGLVREASVEKCLIGKIAPHLAQGLRFIYPVYKHHPFKMWQMKIGVKVYDLLCSGKNYGKSESASIAGTQKWLPKINTNQLCGSVRYFDGLTNDARLTLDSLRSAEANNATVVNYMQLVDATRNGDLWECKVTDHLTGETKTIKAKTVVNATGPWSQGVKSSGLQLRPSKGVHLVLDRAKLPVDDAVVITEGKRILFVIPWGDRIILGTTDTDYPGDIEAVRTEQEDIDYILEAANGAFDNINITQDDVISHWVGLRPLIADPNGKPSDISRKHLIINSNTNWWDVGGGKLTTYRLMAEQTVDKVVKKLSKSVKPCRTDKETILTSDMTDKYSSIVPIKVSKDAVEYFVNNEWAHTLSDVMIRRSSWIHYYANDEEIAKQVADWMGNMLEWDDAEKAKQLADYIDFKKIGSEVTTK